MIRLPICVSLIFSIPFLHADPVSNQDGYAVLMKACDQAGEIWESLEREQKTSIQVLLKEGGVLSDELLNITDRCAPLWEMVQTAATAEQWHHPPFAELTPDDSAASVVRFLQLQQLAGLRALRDLNEGNPRSGISLLLNLHETGRRLSVSGAIMHPLLSFKAMESTWRVERNLVDALSANDLNDIHTLMLEQELSSPPWSRMLEGEQAFMMNTISMAFDDLKNNQAMEMVQPEVVEALRKHGVDESEIKAFREGRFLSPSQWEDRAKQHAGGIVIRYLQDIDTLPSEQLSIRHKQATKEVEALSDLERDGDLAEHWKGFLHKIMEEDFTLESLHRLHEEIGDYLSQELLNILLTPYGGATLTYREHLACRRLTLVHGAARLFELRNRRPPVHLEELVEADLLPKSAITDPLAGETFRLNDDESFGPYSVGRNLKDDQGETVGKPGRDWRPLDIGLPPGFEPRESAP